MSVDHYENFPVASLLVPRHLRRPIQAIYRFARGADDLADEGSCSDAERLRALADYAAELDRIAAAEVPVDAAFQELAMVVRDWHLPLQPFRDLLDAFVQDVGCKRYADYPQLLDYCRRSANPVGRLMLHLMDRASEENLQRSDSICTALQLINFWQDVAIDWQKQRIYLPLADMQRFGVTEADINAGVVSHEFSALMDFQVQRARSMMRHGAPLARRLPGRIGWELRLMVQGGLAILDKIEANGYDVFRHRPTLGKTDWLRLAWRATIR